MTGDPVPNTRPAVRDDADVIAALHAASWRAHYRGSFSDAYLQGPIAAERQAFWHQRLEHPREGMVVILLERDDALIGFVCALLDHDRHFGTLIDNLHVAVGHKGEGLGRRLMREAGEAMLHAVPQRPAHLFVLQANVAAQRFYDRIGGTVAEHMIHTEVDGSSLPVLRYVWPSPAALIEGAGRV